MKPTIDIYNSKDQEAVKNFILDCWKEYGFKYIKKYDYDLDNPDDYYIKTGGIFFVLKDENTIIGTVGIINKGKSVGELKRLYVDMKFRGKGFGAQLVDKALEYCKNHNFKKIEFETNKVFKKAHHLYETSGFKLVKEDKYSFYMEKFL